MAIMTFLYEKLDRMLDGMAEKIATAAGQSGARAMCL
jgi:hypothetical protein